MYEVWKRQQVHEDARKMHRAKGTCPKFWVKIGKATPGGDATCSEGRERL